MTKARRAEDLFSKLPAVVVPPLDTTGQPLLVGKVKLIASVNCTSLNFDVKYSLGSFAEDSARISFLKCNIFN